MRSVVLLRAQSSGTSVAVAPAAPNCTAEGKTREEALQRLRAAVQQWRAGAEITSIDVAENCLTLPRAALEIISGCLLSFWWRCALDSLWWLEGAL